ncbi:uncharacterized protein [Clytia hemisphaerica]|uniref:uncharacterized protein n=1 Tax=Clytia hemisphaerica TaxID=252671 RepID=UPI0034D3E03A
MDLFREYWAEIKGLRVIFDSNETEAIILVDASNAFNSLNRKAALHNIRIMCPQFSFILTNMYRIPVRMIVHGSRDILSVEGTTQGDNLAMSFYALGITPIIDFLKDKVKSVKNVSLADDITGAGKLSDLKVWWETLIEEGKKYGYFVNESKSWLIVKEREKMESAQEIFQNSEIKYTTEGKRHLGAALGSQGFRETYAKEKVKRWCEELEQLSEFAKTQPHAAYTALWGGLHKFTYFLRTIPGMTEYIKPLDEIIAEKFVPNLLDSIITEQDRNLFSLPVKNGGLGIPILAESCDLHINHSRAISGPLQAVIVNQSIDLPNPETVKRIKNEKKREKEQLIKDKATAIDQTLSPSMRKAVDDTRLPGASSWLTVLPLQEYSFALNKGEFRDAVRLRYNRELKGLPSNCPCGQKFDLDHALICKKGGFVIIRHNNIRDFEAGLLSEVHRDVEIEPPLQPIDGERVGGLNGDNARPDVRARGVWRPGQNAYFDVRVTNTNSQSQVQVSTQKTLEKHEREKKRQYNHRVMNIEHGTFTPLIFSVTGVMAKECSIYYKHLADKIARKTEEQYSKVIGVIRCRLSFLILRAALLCVRGSRTKGSKETKIDDFSEVFMKSNMII